MPCNVFLEEFPQLTGLEFSSAEIFHAVHLRGIKQAGQPFAAGETLEIRAALRILDRQAGSVVAIEPVATRAIAGKKFRPLGQGVIAQESDGTRRPKRGRPVCQRRDALGCDVRGALVGEYITSLEMAGLSLTLVSLDDELAHLLEAPAQALATPPLSLPW